MTTTTSPDEGVAHYPGMAVEAPARGLPAFVVLLMITLLLAACGGAENVRPARPVTMPRAWPIVPPADPERANAVLMRAISLVGTPYR